MNKNIQDLVLKKSNVRVYSGSGRRFGKSHFVEQQLKMLEHEGYVIINHPENKHIKLVFKDKKTKDLWLKAYKNQKNKNQKKSAPVPFFYDEYFLK